LSFWSANLVQAALFTSIHWPNWLWVGGFHWSLVMTSVSIFLLGLLLGWLTRRTNSIWPAVAAHILNNFLAAFLG
jgi:membrane protease YdiL (CAAX protease family)